VYYTAGELISQPSATIVPHVGKTSSSSLPREASLPFATGAADALGNYPSPGCTKLERPDLSRILGCDDCRYLECGTSGSRGRDEDGAYAHGVCSRIPQSQKGANRCRARRSLIMAECRVPPNVGLAPDVEVTLNVGVPR
jgi:hypothetical protein